MVYTPYENLQGGEMPRYGTVLGCGFVRIVDDLPLFRKSQNVTWDSRDHLRCQTCPRTAAQWVSESLRSSYWILLQLCMLCPRCLTLLAQKYIWQSCCKYIFVAGWHRKGSTKKKKNEKKKQNLRWESNCHLPEKGAKERAGNPYRTCG